MNQWSVRRRPNGVWGVYYKGHWHDAFNTHAEAILWAHRYAITTAIDNGELKWDANARTWRAQ